MEVEERGTQEELGDKVFSDAFDLAGSDKKEEVTEPETPAPPAPAEAEPKAETPPPQPPPEETYEQRWKTLQGIHRSDKEKWQAREAELLAQVEAAKAPPAEKKDDTALQNLYDSLTAEQKEALKEYEQDFEVVSKMEGIKREIAFKKLKSELAAEIETMVRSQLQPATEFISEAKVTQEEIARINHFKALAEAHSDYEVYRDNGSIVKWIESKPRYMQTALMQTYEAGTASDVVDLITDFKRENNLLPESDNIVSIKKAEKRAAITAPMSRKAAINTSQKATDDYDGAFDEALHKGG